MGLPRGTDRPTNQLDEDADARAGSHEPPTNDRSTLSWEPHYVALVLRGTVDGGSGCTRRVVIV